MPIDPHFFEMQTKVERLVKQLHDDISRLAACEIDFPGATIPMTLEIARLNARLTDLLRLQVQGEQKEKENALLDDQ